MQKPLLLIISGPPCTGKTTLAKKIAKKFSLPRISRDDIKESLFDSLGIKDRDWSRSLGAASFKLLDYLIENLLEANNSLIIETPLNPEYDEEKFQNFQKKYGFKNIQIMCKTDGEILFERFKKRSNSDERHPGHLDHLNHDEFKEILLKGENPPLNLNDKILDIDTTNFENIDYDLIFSTIKSRIETE